MAKKKKPETAPAPRKKPVKELPISAEDVARKLRDAARTPDLAPSMRKTLMDVANSVSDLGPGDETLKRAHAYVTGEGLAEDLKIHTKKAEAPAAKSEPAKAAEPKAEAPKAPAPKAKEPTVKVKVPKATKPAAPADATAGAEAAPRKPLTVGRLAGKTPTEATAPATRSAEAAAAEATKPAPVEAAPAPAAAPEKPVVSKDTAGEALKTAVKAEEGKGILKRLGSMRKSKMGMLGLAGLAALAGGSIYRMAQQPQDTAPAEEALAEAEARSRSAKIAKLLEQARMERSLSENQRRLAQSNPDLYTSVMAGRRVPAGSVVLGGRPRMDLMQELAASMDSGRYARPDPLSELMG